MQQNLFDIPEHARIVTSWNESPLHTYIVKPCLLPGRVILQSLIYDGYSELARVEKDGTIGRGGILDRIVLTNGNPEYSDDPDGDN
jgi:hypothetical protein